MLAAALAQAVQIGQPLLVALAPGGHAVAQPVLLHRDLAAQLVVVGLLLRQHLVAPRLEGGEPAVQAAGDAAVEPDGGARKTFEQPPVVADDDEAGAQAGQLPFQPFDAGEIKMVGRLVEQQDVGARGEGAGQRGAAGLAAGERRGVFRAAEAERAQQGGGPVAVGLGGVGAEAGFDIGQGGREAGQVRFLRQVADGGAGLDEAAAGIGGQQAGGDAQQARFAAAVASDQADTVAGADRERGAGQQWRGAEGEGDVLEGEQRGRHGRGDSTGGGIWRRRKTASLPCARRRPRPPPQSRGGMTVTT